MCCKCKVMTMDQEKKVMQNGFIVVSILQSIVVTALCAVSIKYLSGADVSFFLPVDIVTLLMSVMLLSFVVVIMSWASALNNNSCLWSVFHVFMFVLLLIEMVICMLTSNLQSFLNSAQKEWTYADKSTRLDLQLDLDCCGFINITHMPEYPCPQYATEGCMIKLQKLMEIVRNTA